MVKITFWDKVKRSFTGSFTKKTTLALEAERQAEKQRQIAIEKKRIADAEAKKKAEAEAALKAKSAAKIEEIKKAAKPNPANEAKKPAAKKPAAKKAAPAKPAAKPAAKTASATPKKATAKKPAPKKATGYKANAKDGDGDGLVQDGTPFERPATKSKSTPAPKKKK